MNEKVKETSLFIFVFFCVALIVALWFNSLFNKEVENPYFYRGVPTLSNSLEATYTAIAEQILLGTGTPTPVGHKNMNITSTPTPTPTLMLTPEADG